MTGWRKVLMQLGTQIAITVVAYLCTRLGLSTDIANTVVTALLTALGIGVAGNAVEHVSGAVGAIRTAGAK